MIGKKNAKTSEWGNSFALLTKHLTNQAKFTQRTLETLSQDFELKQQCGHDAVNGHKTIKVVFWLAPNSIDFIGWEIC